MGDFATTHDPADWPAYWEAHSTEAAADADIVTTYAAFKAACKARAALAANLNTMMKTYATVGLAGKVAIIGVDQSRWDYKQNIRYLGTVLHNLDNEAALASEIKHIYLRSVTNQDEF